MQAERGSHRGRRLTFAHAIKRHQAHFFQRHPRYRASVSFRDRLDSGHQLLFSNLLTYE